MRGLNYLKRVPITRLRRCRVVAGIVIAFAGGLLILSGIMYNQRAGFSYDARLIEGEVTVLPHVPFVVKLERFALEYHPKDDLAKLKSRAAQKEQDVILTLLQDGQVIERISTQPGRAAHAEGVSLVPSESDTGWAFSLVVRDPAGREKVITVNPWDPPLTRLGLTRLHVFADTVTRTGTIQEDDTVKARPNAAEIFIVEANGDRQSLGFASDTDPVSVGNYLISIWRILPYTGLHVYHRPGLPILSTGIVCLLAGLLIAAFAYESIKRKSRSA